MSPRIIRNCTGVTVVEIVTVLSIIAILSAISLPAVFWMYSEYERASARESLQTAILRASSRASALATRVVFAFDNTGHGYSVGPDYTPLASPASPETIERTGELPRSVTINPTQPLLFDSRGYLVDATGQLTEAHLVLSQNGTAFTSMTVGPTAGVTFD